MFPQSKVPRLDAPIVLAHGLFGFTRIGLGRITLTPYFRSIPDFLTRAGNRVLVTRVPSIAGVDRRAVRLGEQILKAFPDEPVHVIGHSMGGLDARRLLANPAWQRRIKSLSTIGTPHLGTALADFAKLRVGRIFRLLSSMGIDPQGCLDVTRRAARRFNRKYPAPAGRAVYLGRRQPDARNGLLAPHAHVRRTFGARRTKRRIGPDRLGTGLRNPPAPLARRSPSPDELDGTRRNTPGARAPARSLRTLAKPSRVSRIRK